MAIRIASNVAAATSGVDTRIAEQTPSLYRMQCSGSGHLSRAISDAHSAGADDAGVDAAQVKLPSQRRVDELHRLHTKPLDELAAPGVRLGADLDDGAANLEPRTGRQVVMRE